MVTFDPAKRDWTRRERGLDFLDAEIVWASPCVSFEDARADYGEVRFITVGRLAGRMVIVGWTPRGADRHVFTMRKANAREQKLYGPSIG